jgi:subtilisin family serine protease
VNKLSFIFIALLLLSCGSEKATISTGPVSVVTTKSIEAPKATLKTILENAEGGRYKEGELLVKFKQNVGPAASMQTHRTIGARVLRSLPVANVQHVKLPQGVSVKQAITQYMQDANVEYAEPNYLRFARDTVPNDTFFGQQWALRNLGAFANGTPGADIKASKAWDLSTGDNSVIIAVIDTGIDYSHPDLVNNIWTNPGEPSCSGGTDNDKDGFIGDCRGWNFAYNNNDPADDIGHGTHVAGIIGAIGNNGLGIAGVMWNVKLIALKFIGIFGPQICGEGNDFCGSVADEITAIDYAIKKGAKVINASYGSNQFSQSEFSEISAANDAGVLFIAAADESLSGGANSDVSPDFPATYKLPNIIAVAATDQNDRKAAFSNYGPNSIHVGAPGVYILSTLPPTGVASSFLSLCSGAPFAGYDFCSGTSMATPHVVGIAGLLYSYYTNFIYSQIRATVLRYVDVLPSLQGLVITSGRVDAYKSLSSLLTPTNLAATGSSSGVTLTWTDNATGEDGYKIERAAGGKSLAQIATIGTDSTTFTDTSTSASTTYTYRVRAINNIGESPDGSGNTTSTTTPATTPTPAPSSSGGGGGCSIGGRPSAPIASADLALILGLPIIMVAIRIIRRRKD